MCNFSHFNGWLKNLLYLQKLFLMQRVPDFCAAVRILLKWHFYIFLPPFYILEDLLKNNGSFLCDKVQIWVCHLNWKDVSGVMSVFNFVIVCLVFYFGSLVTWLSVSVSHYLQTPSLFKPHPFHLLCHIVFVCSSFCPLFDCFAPSASFLFVCALILPTFPFASTQIKELVSLILLSTFLLHLDPFPCTIGGPHSWPVPGKNSLLSQLLVT